MTWISDNAIGHLRQVVDWPDLEGTRYRIIEPIARGGMGTVYLAEDGQLDRQVALKVLSGVGAGGSAERMLQEARIIARLEHPGIVPVHDVGQTPDGRIYYVMKVIRGRRLDQHFDDSATLADRLRVFERICEAVSFAHAHGVIHRDLKPQNIMLGAFGEVLVLDWGVAKLLDDGGSEDMLSEAEGQTVIDDPQRTQTLATARGTVVGTPAYMAPEQARGDIEAIDQRCDVFALGAILCFLLTRASPIDRTVFERIRAGDPAADGIGASLPRTIPRSLRSVCLKALAISKEDRYGSAEDFSADIVRFLGGHAVEAHNESIVERLGRVASKYRTLILLVSAYLLVRIILFFVSDR
jgi:serine/threonine protein kinase